MTKNYLRTSLLAIGMLTSSLTLAHGEAQKGVCCTCTATSGTFLRTDCENACIDMCKLNYQTNKYLTCTPAPAGGCTEK